MEKEVRDFGSAIKALKAGYKVAREGWNGKGMYLFMPSRIDVYNPEGVGIRYAIPNDDTFKTKGWGFGEFIVMKPVDNLVIPWLASQTDMLAEDWTVISD